MTRAKTASDIALMLGQNRSDELRYTWVGSGKRFSIYGGIINTVDEVAIAVMNVTDLDPSTKSRRADVISARVLFMFIAATCSRASLTTIADYAQMNHATVIHHRRNAMNYIETGLDRLFNSDLIRVLELLGLYIQQEQP
jgi:hypothetical protein